MIPVIVPQVAHADSRTTGAFPAVAISRESYSDSETMTLLVF